MKTSLPWVLTLCAPLLPPLAPAGFCGPFVQARVDEAARKKRDRQDKVKEAPQPKPLAKVERPRSNSGIDPNPGVRRDRDRDRDRNEDQVRGRDRDRDDWNRNRPVIVTRPVYVPTFPSGPYPYPSGPYPSTPYPYPYPYIDQSGNREDNLLEATGKQMRFALRENEILKPFKLDTDTVGDSIEIHGVVDTVEQLQLALDVARSIDPRTRIVVTRIKIRQR